MSTDKSQPKGFESLDTTRGGYSLSPGHPNLVTKSRPPPQFTFYSPEPQMSGCAIAFGVFTVAFCAAAVLVFILIWGGFIP